MTIERRASPLVELRADGRKLCGLAAVFGQEARIGGFVETIARGAFRDTLGDGHDIVGLVDHDPSKLLGRTRSKTLRLSENERGLAFSIDLAETSIARDVLALAERGDLGGASFAFRVRPDGERWDGRKRELRSVDLLEVSVVQSWPAYSGTSVAARNGVAARPVILSPARVALRHFLEARDQGGKNSTLNGDRR